MKQKGLILVLATAIISGVSIFLNAFGVKGINPFLFTGAKNLLVGIFLFSIILMARQFKDLKNLKKKDWLNLSLIGLIGGSIPFLLFFKGLQLSNAAQGSFVHKTMIVWVAILAIFMLKEKLNKAVMIGAGLLLAGNLLLLKLTTFNLTIGIALIFIATLFWSLEIAVSKKLLKKLSGNTVAFGRMFFGSIFIMAFLLITGQFSLAFALTGAQFSWILITSSFLVGYVMTFYNGLKLVKASTAVAVLTLGSVITTLLQIVFLEKIISASQIVGMTLLVVGVMIFITFQDKQKYVFSHKA